MQHFETMQAVWHAHVQPKHEGHVTTAMAIQLIRLHAGCTARSNDTACSKVLHFSALATYFTSRLTKFDV